MLLKGNVSLGHGYTGPTQQTRLISEDWIGRNAYCLKCNSDRLLPTPTNTPSRDFVCARCEHGYELKSKKGSFVNKVLDGSFKAMVATIQEGKTPTFLLLEYTATWSVRSLRAVHHSLITEAVIEERRPLSVTARRAGWIGCNIVLRSIALQGLIPIVTSGIMGPKEPCRNAFKKLERLSELPYRERNWAGAVLTRIDRLQSSQFSVGDLYRFEPELQSLFPKNLNIKPKIRQQLQYLRDAGLVRFLGGGKYEVINRV